MFKNPVYDGYFADPFVWCHEGIFYAVGTDNISPAPDEKIFPLLRSTDLVTWERLENALIRPPHQLGNTFWAPEVAFCDGLFYMYYSVGFDDKLHQLRVAVSEHPAGPYRDSGAPLSNRLSLPFAIDPHPFRDDDGQWYLFYARDFLDYDDHVRAGTALVVDRLSSMTALAGEERVVLRATADWQRFMRDRPMYDGIYDWHTLEGPCVVKHGDLYYCLFSGGRWEDDTYGVDFAVAPAVCGPYSVASNTGLPRVLRTIANSVGPGHNSLVVGPDGAHYIIYHCWDNQRTARRMCIDKIDWTEDGPRCFLSSTASVTRAESVV